MKIRHLFTNGIVIIFLLLSLGNPSQIKARENNNQTHPQNTGSTAVLFLIDESGGVSGQCAIEGQVLVTDEEEEFRYEFVRLFWWIWKEFYSDDWAIDAPPDLPNLYFGVAQFARDYRETFPFREGEDALVLLDSPDEEEDGLLDSPKGEELDRRLIGNGEEMLAPFDQAWTCQTNYASALERASESLNAVEAERRVLVLITDGSFRGYERQEPSQTELDKVRDETKETLRHLSSEGIQVDVLLLGSNRCRTINCKSLDREPRTVRNVDLNLWDSWEANGLIKLLDVDHPFSSLSENEVIASTLPGYWPSGWIVKEGVKFDLPGSQDLVRVVIVSSQLANDPVQVDKDSEFVVSDLYDDSDGPLWMRDYAYNQQGDTNRDCPRSNWTLINSNRDITHYYWIAPGPNSYPKLNSSYVCHNGSGIQRGAEISLDATKNEVIVQTGLEQFSCPSRPQCYQVKFEIQNQQYQWRDEQILDFSPSNLNLKHLFDQIPNDLPWGSELTISATLIYKASPDNVIDKWSKHFSIAHNLKVLESQVEILPVDTSGNVIIEVPIEGATMLPDGVSPVFGLYPNQLEAGESPTPLSNCSKTYKAKPNAVVATPVSSKHIVRYEVTYPNVDMWDCGYRDLLVQVETGEELRVRKWIDLSTIENGGDNDGDDDEGNGGVCSGAMVIAVLVLWIHITRGG